MSLGSGTVTYLFSLISNNILSSRTFILSFILSFLVCDLCFILSFILSFSFHQPIKRSGSFNLSYPLQKGRNINKNYFFSFLASAFLSLRSSTRFASYSSWTIKPSSSISLYCFKIATRFSTSSNVSSVSIILKRSKQI